MTQELINNYDEMNNGGIGLMISDELKEELKQQQQYYSQPKVANVLLSGGDGITKQENQGYPTTITTILIMKMRITPERRL